MTGSGTALDPWVIWDVNDLQAVGNGAPYLPSEYYELGQDIDATPTTGWNWNAGRGVFQGFVPIGSLFTGSLNGNYHTIDGLYMDWYSTAALRLGLFSYLDTAVAGWVNVQNLYITNADITGYVVHGTNSCLGGILATRLTQHAQVRNVITTGSIHITTDDTAAPGNSLVHAGGLIGYMDNGGRIRQCASYATVTSVGLTNAIGVAGGLVGYMFVNIATTAPLIENSYARGQVNRSGGGNTGGGGLVGSIYNQSTPIVRIDNSYSTGFINAGAWGGGLVGYKAGSGPYSVTDSFWDTQTSGQAASFGGTGQTTLQMKTRTTFTGAGWDFVTIWDIDDVNGYHNDGYPFFRWDPMPTITVVSPNGGEVWYAGDTRTILWMHVPGGGSGLHNIGADVIIELLLAGILDEVIVATTPIGAPGGGTYSWGIAPDKAQDVQYRVRITSVTSPYTDSSDNDFTIKALVIPPPNPVVATLPATEVR